MGDLSTACEACPAGKYGNDGDRLELDGSGFTDGDKVEYQLDTSIVFGKLASEEAKKEFKTNAIVSTLHSFAYANVVKEYKLGTIKGFLTWMDLPKSIRLPYGKESDIFNLIEDYCTSDFLTLEAFKDHLNMHQPDTPFNLFPYVKRLLNAMASGQMPVTHSFYLKLFHILVMNHKIQLDHVERLLVDEFQDMSGLALDIINHIPADQKVFVGDSNQSIFEFLKLKNGFAQYPEAKVLTLSKSFRVDHSYAPAIQNFLQTYLQPNAVFKGMDYPSTAKPITKAYLTRTNASLIAKMIELNKANIPYHLSHKTKIRDMFKFPLALIYAKPGFDQKDPELKHLQHDIDDWGSLPLEKREKTNLFTYLKEANPNDTKITSTINLILKFDRQDVINAHEEAEKHKKIQCNLQLMTAHTSKGATRDIIELDNDMNEAIEQIINIPIDKHTPQDRSELCLYFVAITRHKYELINAKHLTTFKD